MISSVRTMLTCHWSARRIQRYLDADPSAPLTPDEVERLEGHLAMCDKCADVYADHRLLRRRFARWSQAGLPDPAMVARVRLAAHRVIAEDGV